MDDALGIEHERTRVLTRWRRRAIASLLVHLVAFAIPIGLGVAWTLTATSTLSSEGSIVEQTRWWGVLLVGLVGFVLAGALVSRRLQPVAAMLTLDLDFPTEAPSRFSIGWQARGAHRRRHIDRVIGEDPLETVHQDAIRLLQLTLADRTARQHALRVRKFSSMIGSELFLAPGDRMCLEWAALLHHVKKADGAVEELRPWLDGWSDVSLHLRERFDGTGAPAGLEGKNIALAARIVAVAEHFDAMTSIDLRSLPIPADMARIEITHESGTMFDPDVVRAFQAVPVLEMHRPVVAWGGIESIGAVVRRLSLPRVAIVAGVVVSVLMAGTGGRRDVPPTLAYQDEPAEQHEPTQLDETPMASDEHHPLGITVVTTSPSPNVEGTEDDSVPQRIGVVAEVSKAEPIPVVQPTVVASDDRVTTPEDTEVIVAVLDNDGPDGLELDISSLRVLSTSSGSIAIANGRIAYSPPPDAVGTANILYEICSVYGDCDTATVHIEVTAVKDVLPFSADGELQIPSDAGPQVIPWLVVSSGKPPLSSGTVVRTTTDRADLFVSVPKVNSVGTLTFEPKKNTAGMARTTIIIEQPGRPQRTFVFRLIVV